MRLNRDLKDQIRDKIVGKKYTPLFTVIAKKWDALASEVYNDVYSKKDRDLMASLPDGWLPEASYVRVSMAGMDVQFHFSNLPENQQRGGYRRQPRDPEKRRTPNKFDGYRAKNYDAQHKLSVKREKLAAETSKLKEEWGKTHSEVWAFVDQFQTAKRLIESWPEIKSIVEEVVGTENKPSRAVALRTEELNERLGL